MRYCSAGNVVTAKWRDRSDSVDRVRENIYARPSAAAGEKSRYYPAGAAKQAAMRERRVTNRGIVKRTRKPAVIS